MKRRYLVLFVAVPVGFALAVAAFYQIENRRGAQAWESAARDLAARGEPLDLAALLPPPVPDELNLAKAPVVERALGEGYIAAGSTRAVAFADMPYGRDVNPSDVVRENWATGRPLALASWQRHFAKSKQLWHPAQLGTPAADVLGAMTAFAPLLDELVRETETRTEARVPIDWRQEPARNIQFLASLLYVKMVETLRLRACAELAEGRHELALRDTLAALRLCEALGREPLLIGLLHHCTGIGLALQPVWEGLAARQWTAVELQRIQEALRLNDHLEDYVRSVRGDRVIDCLTLESIRQSTAHGEAMLSGGQGKPVAPASEWLARIFTVMPRGWIDQNKATTCQLYQNYIDPVDLRTRRISLQKAAAADAELLALSKQPFLIYTMFARVALQSEAYLLPRGARMQTACDQAEISCALERHYLDRRNYPDALAALVPVYLDRVPSDIIDGAPMRYQRTAEGRYTLYGVGWNGLDEGGTVAWHRNTPAGYPSRPDDRGGDWVWQYTPINPRAGMP